MELVYLYIQEAYGKEYDLHLDFSSNTKIRFDKETQKFSIETIENGYPSDFFGDNIKNITAIVGRNGVGKSTVIDVLSLLQKVRNGYDMYKWLIVYRNNTDYFLEGNIKDGIYTERETESNELIKGVFKNGKFYPNYNPINWDGGKSLDLKYIVPYSKERELRFGYVHRYLVEKSLLIDKFEYLSSPAIQDIFSIYAKEQ